MSSEGNLLKYTANKTVVTAAAANIKSIKYQVRPGRQWKPKRVLEKELGGVRTRVPGVFFGRRV